MFDAIEALTDQLKSQFGLNAVIAYELEFYLEPSPADMAAFWNECLNAYAGLEVFADSYKEEAGDNQYEIALKPAADAIKATADIMTAKELVGYYARLYNAQENFGAKPYDNQPGSGLHVHVHLENAEGENQYTKNGDTLSDALSFSIGGLLATMKEYREAFLPTDASKQRLNDKQETPNTISWGMNNRTTALRIPDHANKRIEHRVGGADADPIMVTHAILKGIIHGLEHKTAAPAPIYGNAFDAQYNLEKLIS